MNNRVSLNEKIAAVRNFNTIAGLTIPIIQQVAAEKGLPVIDLHTALSGKPELFPDGVHPNAAGAKLMARAVYAALVGEEPLQEK